MLTTVLKVLDDVKIEFVEQIETAYHGALVYRQLVWQACSRLVPRITIHVSHSK
jgi:hypothetical protein